MSRSRRKNPICGWTTAKTEKWDKKFWHKKFRQWCKRQDEDFVPMHKDRRAVSNPWSMQKDGKQRFSLKGKWGKILMRK